MTRLPPPLLVGALLAACTLGPPRPVAVDTAHDACAHCRMAVSAVDTAAQLVAPGEEPRFFDDHGCLRGYLRERPAAAGREAVAYVADHRTRAWVPAATAVYTEVPGLATPMGSHLVAHADEASRAADPAVAGAPPLTAAEVFGPGGLPGGAS
jgi:copper chaperone NosL